MGVITARTHTKVLVDSTLSLDFRRAVYTIESGWHLLYIPFLKWVLKSFGKWSLLTLCVGKCMPYKCAFAKLMLFWKLSFDLRSYFILLFTWRFVSDYRIQSHIIIYYFLCCLYWMETAEPDSRHTLLIIPFYYSDCGHWLI